MPPCRFFRLSQTRTPGDEINTGGQREGLREAALGLGANTGETIRSTTVRGHPAIWG